MFIEAIVSKNIKQRGMRSIETLSDKNGKQLYLEEIYF